MTHIKKCWVIEIESKKGRKLLSYCTSDLPALYESREAARRDIQTLDNELKPRPRKAVVAL